MVNDRGQIYTIEGITAGIIMIVTAYLILSTTTIFTPGDVHITDMQLEQTGNDALAMLDSPDSYNLDSVRPNTTNLSFSIQQNNPAIFSTLFNEYLNIKPGSVTQDKIKYSATLFYRNDSAGGVVDSYPFANSAVLTGRENTVKVTRLVLVDDTLNQNPILPDRIQMVLVEVLLWRG
jgi:hypothetical protein